MAATAPEHNRRSGAGVGPSLVGRGPRLRREEADIDPLEVEHLLALLQETRLIASAEAPVVKEVLDAAALTYVAGFAQAISQVFYFLHLLMAQRVQSDE